MPQYIFQLAVPDQKTSTVPGILTILRTDKRIVETCRQPLAGDRCRLLVCKSKRECKAEYDFGIKYDISLSKIKKIGLFHESTSLVEKYISLS